MDSSLFQFTNGLIGRSVWLDRFMYLCADALSFVFALVLAGLWLTWRHGQQRGAFLAVLSAFSALGVAQIIIRLFPRPRPFNVLPAHLLVNASQDPSFPSDHATFAFAIAALVWRCNRKVATWLFALAFVQGIARVYVGAHYPTDIVGGAALGIITSAIVWYVSHLDFCERLLKNRFSLLAQWRVAAKTEDAA